MAPASKGFSMVTECLLENNAKPNDTDDVSSVLICPVCVHEAHCTGWGDSIV